MIYLPCAIGDFPADEKIEDLFGVLLESFEDALDTDPRGELSYVEGDFAYLSEKAEILLEVSVVSGVEISKLSSFVIDARSSCSMNFTVMFSSEMNGWFIKSTVLIRCVGSTFNVALIAS